MNLIRCCRCGSRGAQKYFKKVVFFSPPAVRWFGNPLPSPQRIGEGVCFKCLTK